AGLAKQAHENRALSRYLRYNGQPDMAEVKRISDQAPWDDHEVTLYYLDARREISFARARVLGRPAVHVMRYERTMTDADVPALEARGRRLNAGGGEQPMEVASACTGSAAERAECSATRAENAAARVDQAAVRAEKAADRTEAVVDKMTTMSRPTGGHRHPKKKGEATPPVPAAGGQPPPPPPPTRGRTGPNA